jgi:hypothetical protein
MPPFPAIIKPYLVLVSLLFFSEVDRRRRLLDRRLEMQQLGLEDEEILRVS